MGTIERAKQLAEMLLNELQTIDCQSCINADKWAIVLETVSLSKLNKSAANSLKYRVENRRNTGYTPSNPEVSSCKSNSSEGTNLIPFAINRSYLMKKYMRAIDSFKDLSCDILQNSNIGWLSVAIEYVYKWKVHRFTDIFKNYNVEDIPLWVLAIVYNFALCVSNTGSIDGAIEEMVSWFIEIDSKVKLRKNKSDSKRYFSLPYNFYQRFIHIDTSQFKAVKLTLSAIQEMDSLGHNIVLESNCIDRWYKLANLQSSEVI